MYLYTFSRSLYNILHVSDESKLVSDEEAAVASAEAQTER